jgi:two-component system NtrC family sensor kinase
MTALRSIAIRLMLGFLVIIAITSGVFGVVGIRIIRERVVAEAESKVQTDLNAAREIYQGELADIYDVVRFSADRFYLRDAMMSGLIASAAGELTRVQRREGLDILTLLDEQGVVLFRAASPGHVGDSRAHDELVRAALDRRESVAATSIVASNELWQEGPALAELAASELVPTPDARPRTDSVATDGMMLTAAAPIFDYQNRFIGVLYGGVLLNRRYDLVDKIKQTVFNDARYNDTDIGAVTIFQDDIRISTNVINEDGGRAIGTRVIKDVYDQVVGTGQPRLGRSQAANHAYISVYEPIRSIDGEIIGILGVGTLEEPYADLQRRTTLLFLGITIAVAALAAGLSYVISRRLTGPIKQLVAASSQVADGDLDAKVSVQSVTELAELAHAFNSMASALRTRDEQLKEYAKRKIMESERLAVIGQLAADVAHELNNPLQGIVTYSHLLLEKAPCDGAVSPTVEKIVTQANRCTRILRGLLDFSRPQPPQKKLSNVNAVLEECISLVENQAKFHDIEVVKDWNGAIPEVVIDPSQMQQVFINLLINAAEAMDAGGRLTISTWFDPVSQLIEIEFADTGHGIDAQNMERIFDPFFTTKEVGHGTGLGLAISYGIVKEHDGTISVDSAVGRGTTFTVQLPVKVGSDAVAVAETEAHTP